MPDLRPDHIIEKEKQGKETRRSLLVRKSIAFERTQEGKLMIDRYVELTPILRDLFKPDHPLNLCYSSFPILAIFTILKEGARGSTQDEIVAAFHLPQNEGQLTQGIAYICSSQENNAKNEELPFNFTLHNQLYVRKLSAFFPEFYTRLSRLFENVDVEELDFDMKVIASGKINDKFGQQVHEPELDFIKPIDFKSNTRMVIVNGASFYGKWKYEFAMEDTKRVPFYVNKGKTVDVWMMQINAKLPYAFNKETGCHLLALPYFTHTTMVMLFFVPLERTGLLLIEKNLKRMSPAVIWPQLKTAAEVQVFVPRFEMKSVIDITDQMKELKITYAFEKRMADFGGMARAEALYVPRAYQRCFVSVNEGGLGRPIQPNEIAAQVHVHRHASHKSEPRPSTDQNPDHQHERIHRLSKLMEYSLARHSRHSSQSQPLKRAPASYAVHDSETTSSRTESTTVKSSNLATKSAATIRMDRPFLFQIVDTETKLVLLSGCMRDPSEISYKPAAWVKAGTSANVITWMQVVV